MEISEFQKHIKEIYFANDSKRGKEKTFIWLVEEIGELAEEIRKSDKKNKANGRRICRCVCMVVLGGKFIRN
ncbi:hypothetical protein MSIBF_A2820002 [groundwater metagenome]|uniref:NTP pyrophosphohydrolase MazG putative catalytic core domain-containing protein n=1 Tax=groundwater metagenome TaxID=717931 RepID=A0A098EBI4_9ZZZZ